MTTDTAFLLSIAQDLNTCRDMVGRNPTQARAQADLAVCRLLRYMGYGAIANVWKTITKS